VKNKIVQISIYVNGFTVHAPARDRSNYHPINETKVISTVRSNMTNKHNHMHTHLWSNTKSNDFQSYNTHTLKTTYIVKSSKKVNGFILDTSTPILCKCHHITATQSWWERLDQTTYFW